MLFMMNMLFVVLLMLDCLVRVNGGRLEDDSGYLACVANPSSSGCDYLYAARPSPRQACAILLYALCH